MTNPILQNKRSPNVDLQRLSGRSGRSNMVQPKGIDGESIRYKRQEVQRLAQLAVREKRERDALAQNHRSEPGQNAEIQSSRVYRLDQTENNIEQGMQLDACAQSMQKLDALTRRTYRGSDQKIIEAAHKAQKAYTQKLIDLPNETREKILRAQTRRAIASCIVSLIKEGGSRALALWSLISTVDRGLEHVIHRVLEGTSRSRASTLDRSLEYITNRALASFFRARL